MHMRVEIAVTAAALGTFAALVPAFAHAQPGTAAMLPPVLPTLAPISVTVDNADLTLPLGVAVATAPDGRVLVPLRGIFERLGAKVKFDAPTRSIVATKGATNVFLQLGNTTAVLNGTPRKLSAPAQLVGTVTMVPLRFVAEAFGAKVRFNPQARTVRIVTAEALAANPALAAEMAQPPLTAREPDGAASPAAPLDTTVSGTLVAVDMTNTPPTLTLHVETPTPGNVVVQVPSDARVSEKRGDEPAIPTTLASLRPGDQITARRAAKGLAGEVEADYLEAKGTIKAVAPGDNGATRVTFADDTTVDVAATATVTLGGTAATLADLKPAMGLTVRENPATKQGLSAVATLPEVKIASLAVTGGDKTLTASDTVNVTLVGTPGGKATVSAAGLAPVADLPLTEVAETPGTYTGSFPIPPGYSVDKATVTGALTIDPAHAPVFASPTTLTVDSQPPTIANIQPAGDSTVAERRPDISGDLDDKGAGLDPATLQLLLNGIDVTAKLTRTPTHFALHSTADLPPGTNRVTVTVKDKAGNVAQQDLLFRIVPPVSPLKVVTVSIPDNLDVLQASDMIHVRAEATPGGTARFAIGPNGQINAAMVEEKPGIYTGAYTIRRGDVLTAASVTVTYTPPGGGSGPLTMAAPLKVTLAAGPPVAPVIDQPLAGAATGAYVTVSGHATPDSTVRLTVAFAGKFVVLKRSGNLTSLDLPVGRDGLWTTDLLTLDTGDAGSVSFTATAITILKDGETSSPAVVKFKK